MTILNLCSALKFRIYIFWVYTKSLPPLDHNPRKIPVDDTLIIVLQINIKFLLLNDTQMPHKILSSLLDKIQNTKKLNTRESKERTFEKKVRELVVLILI